MKFPRDLARCTGELPVGGTALVEMVETLFTQKVTSGVEPNAAAAGALQEVIAHLEASAAQRHRLYHYRRRHRSRHYRGKFNSETFSGNLCFFGNRW